MIRSSLLSFLLLLSKSSISAFAACDQCFFGPDDDADCKVYGKLNGEFVAWAQASADCLDNYNIRFNSPDPDSVGCGSPYSINTFVNSIKFETLSNSIRAGLGVDEGGFFENKNNLYVIKDSITVNGQSYSCKVSENDCYNKGMKAYFQTSAGQKEMDDVCGTIVARQFLDRELSQGFARNRLCEDLQASLNPPTVCGTLGNEMVQAVADNPSKACSGYQLGTQNSTVPGCDSVFDQVNNNNNNNDTSNGGRSATLLGPLALAMMLATLFGFIEW